MSTMTLPETNGSSAANPSKAWLKSSVRSFFSGFNWDDRPLDLQASNRSTTTAAPQQSGPLSLTMNVEHFFAAFNWDGAAIAVPHILDAPSPQPDDKITLEDFFGSF